MAYAADLKSASSIVRSVGSIPTPGTTIQFESVISNRLPYIGICTGIGDLQPFCNQ